MDASLFVDATIEGNVDWSKYLAEEDVEAAGEIIAEALLAIEAELAKEGIAFDTALALEVTEYVENLVYALVAYSVETVGAVEAIQAINDDALLMLVGMYNIFDGLVLDVEGTTVDLTVAGDVIAKACDLYYFAYAMVDGGFTVVDICGTEIEGFAGLELEDVLMGDGMEATEAGQAYIAAQILDAFVLNRQHENLIQLWDAKDSIHKEICTVCGTERAPEAIFTDVATNFWATNYIRYAFENGIMNGKGDNAFVPAEFTTRAQFLTVLYRLETGAFDVPYEADAELPFADVLEDELNVWYIDAMEWAYENGILVGYDTGDARPYAPISRVELVTFVARYAEYLGYDVTADMGLAGFEDATEVQAWGVEAMSWAVNAGVIEGYEDNTLRPEDDTLRSEIATVAYRVNEFVLPDYPPSSTFFPGTISHSNRFSELLK